MMQNPKGVGIGVGAIVYNNSKVLLLRCKGGHGAGTWSTPGGHLDLGETFAECAVRETKEETGVDIGGLKFVAVTNDMLPEDEKHYVTVWMEGQYVSGEATVAAGDEVGEVRRFPCSKLPEPLFRCLENLINGNCYPEGAANQSLHGIEPALRAGNSLRPGS